MSLSEIEVRETASQPTAVVRRRASVAEISSAIQEGLKQTYEALAGANLEPAGPPFVRYLSMMEQGAFDTEIGWPLAAEFNGAGDVVASSLPAGSVAVVTYHGPYEGVAEAYTAIQEWCGRQGRTPAGPPWESYFTDPESEPDQSKWRTDIYQPIA
jgi:effector-binding domain-containing protein